MTKVRGCTPGLSGTAAVQRHLWEIGFPCPQPLAGPDELAGFCISAETLVVGDSPVRVGPQVAQLHASALAELIRSAPPVDSVPPLLPPPAWAHWDHTEAGLWARIDGTDIDLNLEPDPPWLSDTARRVRARLASLGDPCVVGHADWWSQNLRWVGQRLHVVYDWDSVTAQPEAILAGEAAYMFAKTDFELDGCAPGANVQLTEQFLVAYENARGRRWTIDQREAAWAAGLWIAAFNARVSRFEARGEGFAELVHSDAEERLRRGGA